MWSSVDTCNPSCYSSFILDQDKKPTQGLVELACIWRISPTISYAIGQQNNHGTSEAAMW